MWSDLRSVSRVSRIAYREFEIAGRRHTYFQTCVVTTRPGTARLIAHVQTIKPYAPGQDHSALFLSGGPEMKRSRHHVAPEGRRPGRASRLIDRPWPTRPTATPRRIGTADGRSHSTRDGRAHYGSSTWRLRQLPSSSATSTVSFLNPVISVTSTCVSKVLKPSTRLSKRHV